MSNGFFDQHGTWIEQAAPAKPQTVRIEGRSYEVTRDGEQYILTGARSARYRTLRNLKHRHMLYLINARDWTASAPRAWLTDKSGKLEVVR